MFLGMLRGLKLTLERGFWASSFLPWCRGFEDFLDFAVMGVSLAVRVTCSGHAGRGPVRFCGWRIEGAGVTRGVARRDW
jgi:hypothetical protein